MRTLVAGLAFVLGSWAMLLAGLPAGASETPQPSGRGVPIVGGVLEVSGQAVYSAQATRQFAGLVAQEPVYLGDVIRTGEGSAVLEFVSGLVVLLRPHSELLLESFTEFVDQPVVGLELRAGHMEVHSSASATALAGVPQSHVSPMRRRLQR